MTNIKPRTSSILQPKGCYVYKVLVGGFCRYIGSGKGIATIQRFSKKLKGRVNHAENENY